MERLGAAYNGSPFASRGEGGFGLATYTENYGLHQWEAADDFLRTDFNADHLLIDGALAGKAEYVTGNFVGNGAMGYRTINLGFRPSLVIEKQEAHDSELLVLLDGLAVSGCEIIDNGFKIYAAGNNYQNRNGYDHPYIAFR